MVHFAEVTICTTSTAIGACVVVVSAFVSASWSQSPDGKVRCTMNELDIQRRLFLGSAFGAVALGPLRTAKADTTFTTFSFRATGAPTARTMPDRLSDIVNVKDWGAIGNHSNNDTAAIQNAIDYCIGVGGGTVFFPQGTYNVSADIAVTSANPAIGVSLIGTGKNGSVLFDTRTGGGPHISGGALERIEGMGQYLTIVATRDNFSMIDCNGQNCDLTAASGALVSHCTFNGYTLDARRSSETVRGWSVGTYGVAIGSGLITACRALGGFEWGYCLSGDGSCFVANTAETVGTAVIVGWKPGTGEVPARGAIVVDLVTERCNTIVNLYNAEGCYVAAGRLTGAVGTPTEDSITNAVWSSSAGGTVTVTTALAHNLTVGAHLLHIDINPGSYVPPQPAGHSEIPQFAICTRVEGQPNQFTYPLAINPAAAFVRGLWTYPLQYSIRCRKVYETVIIGISLQHLATVASVDLQYDGEAEHRNNTCHATIAPWGWIMPAAKNRAAWRFVMCSGNYDYYHSHAASPISQMVFADLPGQAGVVQDGPLESQEYDIVDGDNATFASVQAGGGSGHYKVRYDGTNWRRIG
jgi:hypothetical protein